MRQALLFGIYIRDQGPLIFGSGDVELVLVCITQTVKASKKEYSAQTIWLFR